MALFAAGRRACVVLRQATRAPLTAPLRHRMCWQQQQQQQQQHISICRSLSTTTATASGDGAGELPPRTLTLNTIGPNPGARKQPRRKGRGPGSGRGKTATRGMKGARARGRIRLGFEGGQTPLARRIPKTGFNNKRNQRVITPLNLDKLQMWVAMGRLDSSQPITLKHLYDSNVCGKFKDGVKLLATGKESFSVPIHLEVTQASLAAIEAIEAAGGKVKTVYHSRLAMRACLKPHKFAPELLPRNPQPPPRLHAYYTSDEKRGYLSQKVQLDELLASRGLEAPAAEAATE